jgi:hypothetical protein
MSLSSGLKASIPLFAVTDGRQLNSLVKLNAAAAG